MHAVLDHDAIQFRQRAVAALFDRHVDDHRSGAHGLYHVFGHQHRGRASRDERSGDDDVRLLDALGDQRRLAFLVVVAHVARITALSLGEFFLRVGERNIDELGAERLDLLLGVWPHIGCFDHRPEPLGGGDRLQPRDAHPHDHDPGRLDGAGGGHHHGHHAAVGVGADHHRLVSREIGLRRQHIHALRTRDARQPLHREPGDAAGGERLEALGTVWRQQGDEDLVLAQCGEFTGLWPADLEHELGAGIDIVGRRGKAGARRDELGVGDRRPGPRARLHHDLVEPARGELLDGFGRCGNPRLTWPGLCRNPDLHPCLASVKRAQRPVISLS